MLAEAKAKSINLCREESKGVNYYYTNFLPKVIVTKLVTLKASVLVHKPGIMLPQLISNSQNF
jgi:hypothetical protein